LETPVRSRAWLSGWANTPADHAYGSLSATQREERERSQSSMRVVPLQQNGETNSGGSHGQTPRPPHEREWRTEHLGGGVGRETFSGLPEEWRSLHSVGCISSPTWTTGGHHPFQQGETNPPAAHVKTVATRTQTTTSFHLSPQCRRLIRGTQIQNDVRKAVRTCLPDAP
jgi:hypothetical protein